MPTAGNKLLVRRYIDEVINTGNTSRLSDFVSSDYTETGNPTGTADGVARAKDHILRVRETFPDLYLTVEQQIAEGDWVVTRVTARATHLGTWLGMRPTGKAIEISAINIDRVVNSRIVEHGGAANMLEALLHIGALQVSAVPVPNGDT